MSQFLVSYDLEATNPKPHSKFLDIAVENGWFIVGIDDATGEVVVLPNTTIQKAFDSMQGAIDDFRRIAQLTKAQGYKVNLENVSIVEVKSERHWDNNTFVV